MKSVAVVMFGVVACSGASNKQSASPSAAAEPAPAEAVPEEPDAPAAVAPAPPTQAAVAEPAPPASEPAAPAPDTSSINLVDGSWKITRIISLGSKHEKTTVPATTQCLTKAEPLPDAMPGWPTGVACKSERSIDGTHVNWTFTCTEGTTTIVGKGPLVFTGKKLTATIAVEKATSDGASMGGVRGLMKIAGTHLGPCK